MGEYIKAYALAAFLAMTAPVRDERGAIAINQIMGVIFAVILVVVGLVMLPLIIDQTTASRQSANISYFTGTQAIVDLVPLLYSVGVLGLAGFVALVTLRGKGT